MASEQSGNSEVMRVGHEAGRDAFLDALDTFMDDIGQLGDEDLMASSRCLGWTRADLILHVHLGLQEMLHGIVTPSDATPDTDAAEYWLSDPPGEADRLDGMRFVRLVGAAYRRPTGVTKHLTPTATAIRGAVKRQAEERKSFQGHVMTSGDFLATWAVELAVHQLDLESKAPAAKALRLARETVEALNGKQDGDDETVVLIGTRRLPDESGTLVRFIG